MSWAGSPITSFSMNIREMVLKAMYYVCVFAPNRKEYEC